MNEEQIIIKLGVGTSSAIHFFINRSCSGIIRSLNNLEKFDLIKVVEVHYNHGIKKLYMTEEIYEDYFN